MPLRVLATRGEDADMTSQTPIFHVSRNLFRITLALLLLSGLTACNGLAGFAAKPDARPGETLEAKPKPAPATATAETEEPIEESKPKPSPLYEWKGDGRRVSRIVVNTNEQKAHFYAGEDEIGWSTVATGVSKYPTPTGDFAVMEKVENKRSNLYGKVYGKGGQVIKSSVKVGRDPIPSGGRFEGSHMPYFMRLTHDGVGLHAGPIPNPGQPASHGCIRMPRQLAPVLFKHVSNGTQVAIVGKGPSYGNYVEKQRAIAAARAAEQRRIAAQKAEEAARAQQIAANEPTAPAQSPVTTTPLAPPTQTIPGRVIEEQAQAKDDLAIVEPVTTPTTGETKLKTEPVPAVKPTPDAAAAAAPSAPQPSPTPTLPAVPAPAQATPAPALPATPTPPAQPAPTQPAPAALPTPAPQPPKPAVKPDAPAASTPPPPAVKPEPVAAPPQPVKEPAPAAPAPAAPSENKAG